MRARRLLLVFFLMTVNYLQLFSQNIGSDNLRDTLLDFLISKSDFEKDMKTEGTLLIINDISDAKEI